MGSSNQFMNFCQNVCIERILDAGSNLMSNIVASLLSHLAFAKMGGAGRNQVLARCAACGEPNRMSGAALGGAHLLFHVVEREVDFQNID
jgi:hypothetical protein